MIGTGAATAINSSTSLFGGNVDFAAGIAIQLYSVHHLHRSSCLVFNRPFPFQWKW